MTEDVLVKSQDALLLAGPAYAHSRSAVRRCATKMPKWPTTLICDRSPCTYIFGAVCPKGGKGAVLILGADDKASMNLHPAAFAKIVAVPTESSWSIRLTGAYRRVRCAANLQRYRLYPTAVPSITTVRHRTNTSTSLSASLSDFANGRPGSDQ